MTVSQTAKPAADEQVKLVNPSAVERAGDDVPAQQIGVAGGARHVVAR